MGGKGGSICVSEDLLTTLALLPKFAQRTHLVLRPEKLSLKCFKSKDISWEPVITLTANLYYSLHCISSQYGNSIILHASLLCPVCVHSTGTHAETIQALFCYTRAHRLSAFLPGSPSPVFKAGNTFDQRLGFQGLTLNFLLSSRLMKSSVELKSFCVSCSCNFVH